ncbi:hypothetical protein M514_08911 [Trichuris suis]|uniref:Uncharacterized protein n=1 Tax=Trichuris suis TaxID=68888 RepID=A0A085LYX0_9BILA|nr:hypothetical protein M513_08911 [Trichuris suis]KFD70434.1 hypothetical protein M514_08911 [Trichuris suis]
MAKKGTVETGGRKWMMINVGALTVVLEKRSRPPLYYDCLQARRGLDDADHRLSARRRWLNAISLKAFTLCVSHP